MGPLPLGLLLSTLRQLLPSASLSVCVSVLHFPSALINPFLFLICGFCAFPSVCGLLFSLLGSNLHQGEAQMSMVFAPRLSEAAPTSHAASWSPYDNNGG